MKVGIIQSNYIPWRGYFDIIDDVDLFIFYDDVQYTKNDWRNRNKIKGSNGLIWLTVPVLYKFSRRSTIEDTKIDYSVKWVKQHIESIRCAYSKADFFKDYADDLFELLRNEYETVSELNVNIIKWIMEKLGIATKTRISSEFHGSGTKTERLVNILKNAGATSYLSGPSAKDYIEDEKFANAGIDLEYKVYEYREYRQLHGKFAPDVSVLDMLFNCGKDSREYLKSLKESERAVL